MVIFIEPCSVNYSVQQKIFFITGFFGGFDYILGTEFKYFLSFSLSRHVLEQGSPNFFEGGPDNKETISSRAGQIIRADISCYTKLKYDIIIDSKQTNK